MIIKKLAAGFRNRDWIEILIELAIVVAGILIAVQVNNWAGERSDRKIEHAALERLLGEFENTIEELDHTIAYNDRLIGLQRQGVSAATGQSEVPAHDLPLRIGINTISFSPPLSTPRTTYDELTSAGQMQLIRSRDIREQIARFYGFLDEFQQRSQRGNNDDFFARYLKHVTYDYNPESKTSDVVLSTYDWESIQNDSVFVSMLVGELRNQLNIQESRQALRDSAAKICAAIAAEVESECKGAVPKDSPE